MYNNRKFEIDMDVVAAYLKEAATKVKTQEDPDVLNDIKKVFKKNVPFTLRMYVAAYLVKELEKKGGLHISRRDFRDSKHFGNRDFAGRDRKSGRNSRYSENSENSAENRESRPRVQIDPSVAATIFISAGRNRHVFIRDLVGMLINVGGIEKERIGDIRILSSYSFVQLFKEDAEKAINALNGYMYRGRPLSVSYSRFKDSSDDSAVQEGFETSENAENQVEESQSAEDAAAYAAATRAASANEPFSTSIKTQD